MEDVGPYGQVDLLLETFSGRTGVVVQGPELSEVGPDISGVFDLAQLHLGIGRFVGIQVFGPDICGVVRPGVSITKGVISVKVPSLRGAGEKCADPGNPLLISGSGVKAQVLGD